MYFLEIMIFIFNQQSMLDENLILIMIISKEYEPEKTQSAISLFYNADTCSMNGLEHYCYHYFR